MKVLRLDVSGFKGIEAREVVCEGKHVVARGANGTGKTSLAESLPFVLLGEGGQQPLRFGSDEAEVSVHVGDVVFTRRQKDGKSSLSAKNADGTAIKSPAAFLAKMVGTGLALNPTKLFGLKDAEQLPAILKALSVDVSAETKAHDQAYEQRTEVNRRLRAASDRAEELRRDGARVDAPAPPSSGELQARMASARERERTELRRAEALVTAQEIVAEKQQALEAAMQALAAAEEVLAAQEATKVDEGALEAVTAVSEELAGVESAITAARSGQELRDRLKQVEELGALEKSLTAACEGAKEGRAKKITAAATKVGIEGLTFDPAGLGLTFKGVRLAELNGAEKVKLGLRIAAATMPQIRVAIVDEASELDAGSLRELLGWASSVDVQLWLAFVSDAPDLEVQFFDGEGDVPFTTRR